MGYNMTYCECPVCGADAEYDCEEDKVYCQVCIRRKHEDEDRRERKRKEGDKETFHLSQ